MIRMILVIFLIRNSNNNCSVSRLSLRECAAPFSLGLSYAATLREPWLEDLPGSCALSVSVFGFRV